MRAQEALQSARERAADSWLRRAKRASLRERGYAMREEASLSPLPSVSMRELPLPRSLWSSVKVGTLDIQQVLFKRGRGPRLALVWGWPTPIRMNALTELSPRPRKPVYGPAAIEEARRLIRDASRARINLGWFTKKSLCKVAKGERPLSYSVWERTQAYTRRIRREREHERDVRERPLQLRFVPGRGLLFEWRKGIPPVPAPDSRGAPGGSPLA